MVVQAASNANLSCWLLAVKLSLNITFQHDYKGNTVENYSFSLEDLRLRDQSVCGMRACLPVLLCPFYKEIFGAHRALGRVCRCQDECR